MTYVPPTLEESGSHSISELKGRHPNSTAYIVGKGPSLTHIRAGDFVPSAPVLALNDAIRVIQVLGLPNPIYAMQIDGCETEDPETIPRPCGSCEPLGWIRPPLVDPFPGINTVFLRHFSSWCLSGRERRYVIDKEFYESERTLSVLQAIGLAGWMGATSIVMIAFDSVATGDLGYFDEARYSPTQIAKLRSNLEYGRPRILAALSAFGPHSWLTPT